MTSPPFMRQRPLRGIAFVLVAVLVFACMDTTGKHLASLYPVPFFMAVRYAINFLLVVVVFYPQHGRAIMRINRKGLVVLRGASLAISSLFAGLALSQMPVAETVAIVYLAPFGVLLLSGPLLHEPVRRSGWVAAVVGFIGLLLIVRPGSGLAPLGVVFALGTIAGTIIYHMLSRSLARTESTVSLQFYTSLIGAVVFCSLLPWNVPAQSPHGINIAFLIAMGFMSFSGHFLFTAAYREAPVSLLTPVNYMHLAWAALLGWLVFNHLPDGLSMLGIALVAAAGAGNALWAHFRPKAQTISIQDPPQEG